MPFTSLPATATLDDLTPTQRAFVEEFIALDGRAGAEVDAALTIGLGNGVRDKAARSAREMMRNKRVLSAIRSELADKLTSAASLGVATLIDLARNGPPSVRLTAAQNLLDRGIGPVMSRSAVAVINQNSPEALLEAFEERQRAKKLGLPDPFGVTVEAEFEVVE